MDIYMIHSLYIALHCVPTIQSKIIFLHYISIPPFTTLHPIPLVATILLFVSISFCFISLMSEVM